MALYYNTLSRKRIFAMVDTVDTQCDSNIKKRFNFDNNYNLNNDVFIDDDVFINDDIEIDDFDNLSKMIIEAKNLDFTYKVHENIDKDIYFLNEYIQYMWLL